MRQVRSFFISGLWLFAMGASLFCQAAFADEYADVSKLVRSGHLPAALEKADAYLLSNPRDVQMRFMRGVIQRDSGLVQDAIATFDQLTQDYPELPEPYNNLAVLYAGQNQYEHALAALQMAIRINPSYAVAQENLGDVYAKLASQSYSKAIQLAPGSKAAIAPKLNLTRQLLEPKGSAACGLSSSSCSQTN
jgi:tetratricopeptide (TPR) repeat protein